MENCASENIKIDVETPHKNIMESIEKRKKKKHVCDVDININKGNKQLKSDKVSLLIERICAEDDETWNIDDASDSDGDTIGNGIKVFTSLSDALKDNASTKLKAERKMLAAIRKSPNFSPNVFENSHIDKELVNQEINTKFNCPVVEVKYPLDSKDTSIENRVPKISCSESPHTFMQKLFSLSHHEEKFSEAVRTLSECNSDSSNISPCSKDLAEEQIKKQEFIDNEIRKFNELKESYFPIKKKKNLDTEKLNFKKLKNNVDQNSTNVEPAILQLKSKVRSEFKNDGNLKSINDQGPCENDESVLNCFNEPDSRSHWITVAPNPTDLPNPSLCSTNLSSSSNFSKLPCSFDSPTSVGDNLIWSNKLETKSSINSYNKVVLNDLSSSKEMSEENIKLLPLEEFVHTKDLSNLVSSDCSDVDPDSEYSDCSVEDPDLVNPDILYNINLNEYYIQMELLVQKISETPEDQTVFAECMQFPPIPEIEYEPKTFKDKKYDNFANGISEYEYEIDSDDWNKVMVKRAVIFTAHAGFTIANEESLYVLADVAIDYIKKLAVIMKNNFDIQEASSYPECIDPINNSLIQIGVNGGVTELIRHYQNDVFGRRDKLIKKCQHLQKIIDQYTERMLSINVITQNSPKEEFVIENPTSEKVIVKEENILKEEKTEMETMIDEVQSEVVSTIEEVEIETQSTIVENMLVNIKVEQIEPVSINNTDVEIKIETNENIKSEPVDSCDIKIEYNETVNTKSMDVDISNHLDVKSDCTSLNDMCSKDFTSPGTEDLGYPFKCSDNSNSSSCTKKNKKLLEFTTVKKWLKQFYPQEVEPESEPDPAEETRIIRKRLQEHATEFNALLESYASYNNSLSTDSDDNLVDNKHTPPQTVIVNQKSDKNEASS